MVLSRARFIRDCLSDLFDDDPDLSVNESCASLEQTLAALQALNAEVILLDAAFPTGAQAARRLHALNPALQIVVLGLNESEQDILSWAEAGIAGYVPDTSPLAELPALVRRIRLGEQVCAPPIAGALLRRVAGEGRRRYPNEISSASLTARERDILRHIGGGLTNKEIARRLDISLATAKSHVHNILGKLHLNSRAQVAARMNGLDDARSD